MLLMLLRSIFILLLAFSSNVSALGLGHFWVYSALNQPLKAKIQLVGFDNQLSIDDLNIALGSHQRYRMLNLKRAAYVGSLRVALVQEQDKLFIEINSPVALTAPYLDVVVELAWPTGEIIRQYTFLLDPPELMRATVDPQSAKRPAVVISPDKPQDVITKIAVEPLQATPQVAPAVTVDIEKDIAAHEAQLSKKLDKEIFQPSDQALEWLEELRSTGEELSSERQQHADQMPVKQEEAPSKQVVTEVPTHVLTNKMTAIKEALKAIKEDMTLIFDGEQQGIEPEEADSTPIDAVAMPAASIEAKQSQVNENAMVQDLKKAIVKGHSVQTEKEDASLPQQYQFIPTDPNDPYRGPLTREFTNIETSATETVLPNSSGGDVIQDYLVERSASQPLGGRSFALFHQVGLLLIGLFALGYLLQIVQRYRRYLALSNDPDQSAVAEQLFSDYSQLAVIGRRQEDATEQVFATEIHTGPSRRAILADCSDNAENHGDHVRCELAAACIAIGDFSRAERLLRAVLATDNTQAVHDRARILLKKIS